MTSTVACVSTYENNIELNAVFMTQACSASLLINISTWRSVDDCAAISWWRVSKKEVPHERQVDTWPVTANRFVQSTAGAASGFCAHFTASVCSGSTRSQCRHLNSVRPFSAMRAFIRFLQCEQRVVSMIDLSLAPLIGPWNKSSLAEFE
jgi:hypothetical protein